MGAAESSPSLGGMASFNIEDGGLEAYCRNLRKTFLTTANYETISKVPANSQAGLSALRKALEATDYSDFLNDYDDSELEPKRFMRRLKEKIAHEFHFMRSQAVQPLAEFLDFIAYEYVIRDILLLVQAATSTTTGISPDQMTNMLNECHPISDPYFSKEMKMCIIALTAADSDPVAVMSQLYHDVLVVSPVGKYFEQFLLSASDKDSGLDQDQVSSIFKEEPMTIVKAMVEKFYLEDFYAFCQQLGGDTAIFMGAILEAQADLKAISITYTSMDTPLGSAEGLQKRRSLFPSFGIMYPEGTHGPVVASADPNAVPSLASVKTFEEMGKALQPYQAYRMLWAQFCPKLHSSTMGGDNVDDASDDDDDLVRCVRGRERIRLRRARRSDLPPPPHTHTHAYAPPLTHLHLSPLSSFPSRVSQQDLDDGFSTFNAELLETAFGSQFHYASFYAYVKLKELEAANIHWAAECIYIDRKEAIMPKVVPILESAGPRAWYTQSGAR